MYNNKLKKKTTVPDKMTVTHFFLTRLDIPTSINTNGMVVKVEPEEGTRLICERFSTLFSRNCKCVRMSIRNALRAVVSEWPKDPRTGRPVSQNAVFMNHESPGHPYANLIHRVLEMWGKEFVPDRKDKTCRMGNNCNKK